MRPALALLLMLPLSGCLWVDDTDDLQRYTREQQARPSGKIEPLPTFKPYESFVYEGSTLRDPFRKLVRDTGERDELAGSDAIKPDMEQPKSIWKSLRWISCIWWASSPSRAAKRFGR